MKDRKAVTAVRDDDDVSPNVCNVRALWLELQSLIISRIWRCDTDRTVFALRRESEFEPKNPCKNKSLALEYAFRITALERETQVGHGHSLFNYLSLTCEPQASGSLSFFMIHIS